MGADDSFRKGKNFFHRLWNHYFIVSPKAEHFMEFIGEIRTRIGRNITSLLYLSKIHPRQTFNNLRISKLMRDLMLKDSQD